MNPKEPGTGQMRILIVTDAWVPQVNGVVRTLQAVRGALCAMGHAVEIVGPDRFATLPCPTYPEIRLAMVPPRRIGALIGAFRPDAIHLATEGPLCLAARQWCQREGLAFTTAYHTNFPDYVRSRTGLPANWFWPYFRWFHGPARAVLASTPTIRAALHRAGIARTHHWGRGVDTALFRPDGPVHPLLDALPRPILLHVGRVAVEKNIEPFLALDVPGSKLVVGEGPARAVLAARYAGAHFLGLQHGEALASLYRGADCLVFPSRTDTFGLVMIEALACGTPVAAYPVAGPLDVLDETVGAMDPALGQAVARALTRDRAACAVLGRQFTWDRSAREFLGSLHRLDGYPAARAA